MAKREYPLPKYNTKFTIMRNPLIDLPVVKDWTQRVFDYSQIPEDKFGSIESSKYFVAHMFPLLSEMKRMEIMVVFFLLYFVIDDHTECEFGQGARDAPRCNLIYGQVLSALDKLSGDKGFVSARDWKPYVALLHNTMEDMFQDVERVTKDRAIRFYREYIEGNIAETSKVYYDKGFTSISELLEIKRSSMAVLSVFQAIEYCNGITVSEEEWNDPDFQEIIKLCKDAIIYANDVHSFEKEWKEQGKRLERAPNIVAQVVLKDKCSVEEAMLKVIKMNEENETQAIEAMKKFQADKTKSEVQKKFIVELDHNCAGNFHCGVIIARYDFAGDL